MRAYTQSARLADYLIVESTTRFVHRYSWKNDITGAGRLMPCQQRRGPVTVPSLGLSLTFEQIYAKANVPAILHQIGDRDDDESEIIVD
jgi:hypothetical protein